MIAANSDEDSGSDDSGRNKTRASHWGGSPAAATSLRHSIELPGGRQYPGRPRYYLDGSAGGKMKDSMVAADAR
ncbi:hypothetical protein Enr8_26760 [Blastopirellula retiformator]|uniref:Uncharacterized protein n=1 Tax=Blastopirellula retiformator TaxID=2527970 RepID=A0A5C5V4H0_9BACT|nr:hypothetical protein Enr8_26760 [Blastopirellula retiformator]